MLIIGVEPFSPSFPLSSNFCSSVKSAKVKALPVSPLGPVSPFKDSNHSVSETNTVELSLL
jgi:hypothetical protein